MPALNVKPNLLEEVARAFSHHGRDFSAAREDAVQIDGIGNVSQLFNLLRPLVVHPDLEGPTKSLITDVECGEPGSRQYYYDCAFNYPHDYRNTQHSTVGQAFGAMCSRAELTIVAAKDLLENNEGFTAPITTEHPTATKVRFEDGVEAPLPVLTNELTIFLWPDRNSVEW
jgi:hypothetical protein